MTNENKNAFISCFWRYFKKLPTGTFDKLIYSIKLWAETNQNLVMAFLWVYNTGTVLGGHWKLRNWPDISTISIHEIFCLLQYKGSLFESVPNIYAMMSLTLHMI